MGRDEDWQRRLPCRTHRRCLSALRPRFVSVELERAGECLFPPCPGEVIFRSVGELSQSRGGQVARVTKRISPCSPSWSLDVPSHRETDLHLTVCSLAGPPSREDGTRHLDDLRGAPGGAGRGEAT